MLNDAVGFEKIFIAVGYTCLLYTSNTRTELVLNRSYHEMAEHYGTAIIPARPVKPKDKPNAEGTVRVLETWILAAL